MMTLLAFLDGGEVFVLAVCMLMMAILLRRSARGVQASQRRDAHADAQRQMERAERHPSSEINRLEVKLHDFERDVSGRVETTLTALDQLVEEADREIIRLEELLEERENAGKRTGRVPDVVIDSPIPPEDRRMIVCLADAGFSVSEVANCVNRPESEVRRVVEAYRRDAA